MKVTLLTGHYNTQYEWCPESVKTHIKLNAEWAPLELHPIGGSLHENSKYVY